MTFGTLVVLGFSWNVLVYFAGISEPPCTPSCLLLASMTERRNDGILVQQADGRIALCDFGCVWFKRSEDWVCV